MRAIEGVFLVTFAAVGLARVLRAWGPIRKLYKAGHKPWACDACMAAWCSLVGCVAAVLTGYLPISLVAMVLPAAVGAAATLLTITKPPLAPPPLP